MEDGIQKVEAQILDHIGIASDVIEELRLVKIIDSIIPKKASHYRITHGQAVKAIILSGLGFQDRRLYSVDRFFKNRPVDVIFGKDITWDYFSDDALGETLDRIYKFGVDKFFSEISSRIILNNKYLYSNVSNIDTSSLSLSGKFKNKKSEIKPLLGHSKKNRPDLRQLILSMAITGPAQVPFWMTVDNGNISDKELLPEMMKRIEGFKTLMFGGNQKSITIADSALFSKEFLSKFYSSAKWVSRLSESYKIAKELLEESLSVNEWSKYGQYRYFSRIVKYDRYLLKAIVVHHRKSSYREIATVNKNYIKASNKLKKSIKRIQGKVYKTRKSIEREVEKLI
ncbi:MAG: IS1634 family transposase, partial [Oligoflexia bacterium]|nr:IS1634 family transposase [Oligoflexia bacterium]